MNNLNPHSRLASFYRYFYLTGDLPNNLCNYFWGLIVAFVCFPFVWTSIFLNYLTDKICYLPTINRYCVGYKPLPTPVGLVFNIFIFIIGCVGFKLLGFIFSQTIMFFLLDHMFVVSALIFLYFLGLITILVVVVVFNIIVGLVRFATSFKKKLTEEELRLQEEKETQKYTEYWANKRKKEANPNFLVLTWRWLVAFKEKNCPIITWDYDNNKKK